MKGVGNVLKEYGRQYLSQYGHQLNAQHKKVLRAAMACREESLGTISYGCTCCGQQQHVPRSCCNRHCSVCQHQQQQAWLESCKAKLLPCQYFMLTFTLPSQLRPLALHQPKMVYKAMFAAAVETIRKSATNERHVGVCETGFMVVLQTWGRDLNFHPHLHVLIPAGGIDKLGAWRSSRSSVFVPEQVLAHKFRSILEDKLSEVAGIEEVPKSVWAIRWVVDSSRVGNGESTLAYLAPYVSRGAVSDWRVTKFQAGGNLDEAMLELQVKRSGTADYVGQPMKVREFLRRWLQHVMPQGFHCVRHYGFLNSRSKRSIEDVRWLVAVSLECLYLLAYTQQVVMAEPLPMRCPACGGAMVFLAYRLAETFVESTAQPTRAPP